MASRRRPTPALRERAVEINQHKTHFPVSLPAHLKIVGLHHAKGTCHALYGIYIDKSHESLENPKD